MERILAHVIVYEGCEYRNCIVELADDGAVRIYPYECEVHSTRFVPGRIDVRIVKDPKPRLQIKSESSNVWHYPFDARR